MTDHEGRESTMAETIEETLVLVKPDGVARNLTGEILRRIEAKGYALTDIRMVEAERSLLAQHYAEHRGKPFYEGLISYITSAPVVAAVFEGLDAVAVVRSTVGATNPAAAAPGTIRGDWAVEIGRNLVHASDSPETGKTEIALWFKPADLTGWQRDTDRWISETA